MALLRDAIVQIVAVDAPMTVRHAIERHVDPARVEVLEAAEASERELLGGLPAMLRGPG